MSIPFSRENSVRPDKNIRAMNYGEFRVYAMKKIQWEEENCSKQIDALNQEFYNLTQELENEKKKLNDTDDEKQLQNIMFIMENIKPGINVKSEVEATRYVTKLNNRIKEKKQEYQTLCNRETEIKNKIKKINDTMASWHKDYEYYRNKSSENDKKRIKVDFWDVFPVIIAYVFYAYFGICFFACFLASCNLTSSCSGIYDSCSGIYDICDLLVAGCGYLFVPDNTDSSNSLFYGIMSLICNMIFYLILSIIGAIIYSKNKSIDIDERFLN